jgi:hypothetical protein
MHVDPSTLADIQRALGCKIEGFPQTYLGLPLSASKLKISAFAPLIVKVDRFLSGWRSLLLSPGGRLARAALCLWLSDRDLTIWHIIFCSLNICNILFH